MDRWPSLQILVKVKPKQRIAKQYHQITFTRITYASNTYKFRCYARTTQYCNLFSAEATDQPSVEALRASAVSFVSL